MLSPWANSSIVTPPSTTDFSATKKLALAAAPISDLATITCCEGNTSDVTLFLRGEFGMDNRELLASALEEALASRLITVDLSETSGIDATILGVLARFARLRKERHVAPIQISHANAHCRELLSLYKLNSILNIEEEATWQSK